MICGPSAPVCPGRRSGTPRACACTANGHAFRATPIPGDLRVARLTRASFGAGRHDYKDLEDTTAILGFGALRRPSSDGGESFADQGLRCGAASGGLSRATRKEYTAVVVMAGRGPRHINGWIVADKGHATALITTPQLHGLHASAHTMSGGAPGRAR